VAARDRYPAASGRAQRVARGSIRACASAPEALPSCMVGGLEGAGGEVRAHRAAERVEGGLGVRDVTEVIHHRVIIRSYGLPV